MHWITRPKASKSILRLAREEDIVIQIVICTRTVCFFEIVCHPFLVFGQREEASFEVPKFGGFGRQTSHFQQFCVFGRFRTILLCCEHEASPFPPVSVTGALVLI